MFVESWVGTFYDYMNSVPQAEQIFEMDYSAMRAYCKELKFDGANHEAHMPQVIAWSKRHNRK